MINLKFSNMEESPFYDVKIDEFGNINYYNKKGKLHNSLGPAVEYPDGGKEYWINGKLNRLDGPAIEYPNGGKFYYINDKLHRIDGPAIEIPNGFKAYYINGKRHRLDGPAILWHFGLKEYYVNDKLHRLDGPARIWPNGKVEYWVKNKYLTKQEFNKLKNNLKFTSLSPEIDYDKTRQQYFINEIEGPAYDNLDFQESFDTDLNLPDSQRKEKEIVDFDGRKNLQLWTS